MANLILDGKPHQQVILFAGSKRHTYRLSFGTSPGRHVTRSLFSVMSGSPRQEPVLEAHSVEIEEISRSNSEYDVVRLCAGAFREVEHGRAVFRHPAAVVLRATACRTARIRCSTPSSSRTRMAALRHGADGALGSDHRYRVRLQTIS